jgi:hypothetical protein
MQLRAFALFSLFSKLSTELFYFLGANTPEMAQLEVNHRIGRGQGIGQQALKSFELLLRSDNLAFLLLELIEEFMALTPEVVEFSFYARTVGVQL